VLPLARSHHHATNAVYLPASPHGVLTRSLPRSLTLAPRVLHYVARVPAAPLYLGCSRRARPLPRGLTGHVAHPIRSIREQGIRHLVDADSGKFPREDYRAIAPLSVRFGASASSLSDLRSLVTKVLFSPRVDHGPRGTSRKSTNLQSVTSVSFNPR